MTSPAPEAAPTQTNGSSRGIFSLANILGHHDNLEHPKYREEDKPAGGWDEEITEKPVADGFCVECEGE